MLIKQHISKRHLKRPEGEEAIRAHLYVDEREKCRQTLHQNTEGGRSLASAAKYAPPERGERGSDRAGERGSEVAVGLGWRVVGEGERDVLFAIRPFLFYAAPKKNRRTNTFLNKGRALEVEARWGREVAPLRVTTE